MRVKGRRVRFQDAPSRARHTRRHRTVSPAYPLRKPEVGLGPAGERELLSLLSSTIQLTTNAYAAINQRASFAVVREHVELVDAVRLRDVRARGHQRVCSVSSSCFESSIRECRQKSVSVDPRAFDGRRLANRRQRSRATGVACRQRGGTYKQNAEIPDFHSCFPTWSGPACDPEPCRQQMVKARPSIRLCAVFQCRASSFNHCQKKTRRGARRAKVCLS